MNFLAASANHVSRGISGSGIYSGSFGSLGSFVTGSIAANTNSTVLLTNNVPTIPSPIPDLVEDQLFGTDLHTLIMANDNITYASDAFRFIIPTNTTIQNFTLCQSSNVNQLCCNFEIQTIPIAPPGPPANTVCSHYFTIQFH